MLRQIKGAWICTEPKMVHGRQKLLLTSVASDALRRHHLRQAAEHLALGPICADGTESDLVFTDEVRQPLRGTAAYRERFTSLCRQATCPRSATIICVTMLFAARSEGPPRSNAFPKSCARFFAAPLMYA